MNLPQVLKIPCSKPIRAEIHIPGSKSITNRAILISSLARGTSKLNGFLHSDDTHYMTEAWKNLGVQFETVGNQLEIRGCAGKIVPYPGEIYVENAGTAARFLTAALVLGRGEYVLNGNRRMRQRPIKDLIFALNGLGAKVTDIAGTGCPPVRITAEGLQGGTVSIPGNKSSQYISAILMAAPYAKNQTVINIKGDLVSRSYVDMTINIMRAFKVHCHWLNPYSIEIAANQVYQARNYQIEGDASSASYFFAMAAITRGRIKVHGLGPDSMQSDLKLLQILEKMGCSIRWEENSVVLEGNPLRAVEVDMNNMSDVAPTLAVVALFAKGVTKIVNVENMRIKECDRINAIVTELRKLGAEVEEWKDGLSIKGQESYSAADFQTYDDHRLAMSFSLVGLRIPGITIQNPQCVSKTFPNFYQLFLPLINE